METLEFLDLTIIVAYMALVVVIGLYFSRNELTSEDFFLAGRKLTWPLIGASLFASNIGTEHLVGLAGDAHRVGLVVGGFEWMACFCLITLGVLFVPQYLRSTIYTIPEFLEKRFSVWARTGLSVFSMAMIIITKVSIALWAGSLVVESFFGWDAGTVRWGIGAFTALYTAAGGLGAVVYTDALQTVILVSGSAVLTLIGFSKVGGWLGLAELLPEGHLHMVKPLTDPDYPITGFIFGNYLAGLFYWCIDQSIVQRVLGARDVDQGRIGAIFGGFLKLLPVFIFVLPGVMAYALYPTIKHDQAFSTLVGELLPKGLKGLVIAGLLAALMSSLDSTLNAAATLVTRDFVVRFRKSKPSQMSQIWIGRITIAVVVTAGILWAPVIGKAETMWKYLQVISAYMGMPMVVAMLVGIFWKRATNAGALSAMVFGTALGVVMMIDSAYEAEGGLISALQAPIMVSFMHRSLVAFLASTAVMVGVSLLTSPPAPQRISGVCFSWSREAREEEWALWRDYRTWVGVLVVLVVSCWVIFR